MNGAEEGGEADGGGGETVEPSQGDTISVTLEGQVTRAGNGMVYFKPATANGVPMSEAMESDAETTGDMEQEGNALAKMSEDSDGGGY